MHSNRSMHENVSRLTCTLLAAQHLAGFACNQHVLLAANTDPALRRTVIFEVEVGASWATQRPQRRTCASLDVSLKPSTKALTSSGETVGKAASQAHTPPSWPQIAACFS
jgi:hypothetical protein